MADNTSIKTWPQNDRPREKLLSQGEQSLTDTELLAILLRTGVKGESAVDVARKIMSKFGTFRNMGQTDLRDWKEVKGIGGAKLAQIKAAIEIARRFSQQDAKEDKKSLKTSKDIVEIFKSEMRGLKNETVKAVFCDAQNRIIKTVDVSKGSPTESYPLIREIISEALQNFAVGLICLHNHPAGNSCPSSDDEAFTRKLKEVCLIMGLRLLDHIIFGEDSYYSFDKREIVEY